MKETWDKFIVGLMASGIFVGIVALIAGVISLFLGIILLVLKTIWYLF